MQSNRSTYCRGCTGCPGRNSGASACRDPIEGASLLVSCPPNALPAPLTVCVPAPPRLPNLPPLPPRALGPFALVPESSDTMGSSCWFWGVTEYGRSAGEKSEGTDGTVEVEGFGPSRGAF
jgi:hypothetical protein